MRRAAFLHCSLAAVRVPMPPRAGARRRAARS